MATAVPPVVGRMVSALREFTIAQRTIALIGLGVLVLGATALGFWLARPSYTPLFSGLQAADASLVVEQLQADNVPYQLTDGGGTILVPQENVYDQRLKAASSGLPAAEADGYSLLDSVGVTSSEFQQDVTYKRALEGELASTVASLDGVKGASVQLAIPEETVFTENAAEPTASVFVETQPGRGLTKEQVQAVVHLTSAAIEGLTPANVAVVDSSGKVLSAVGSGAVGSADEQATDYEQRVSAAVQGVLDRVVGVGNATVAVAADMSTDTTERISETYGGRKTALTETSDSESYTGTGGGSGGGVLGPDNIAVPEGANGTGEYLNESASRTNAVDKVVETSSIPAGQVRRQSISVAIDAAAAGGVDVDALSNLVSSAAGVDNQRGDSLAVEVVPFNTQAAEQAAAALAAAQAAEEAARQEELIRGGIIAAAVVLGLAMAAFFIARARRRDRREPLESPEEFELEEMRTLARLGSAPTAAVTAPPATTSIPAVLPAVAQAPAIEALPTARPELAAGASTQADRQRAAVGHLAATDPARTAEFLRALIDGDSGTAPAAAKPAAPAPAGTPAQDPSAAPATAPAAAENVPA
ncbi:hypothetical protein NCCP1664_01390 [Zafaria cholistanensis]|uniref:Flagellar M-ring protein n=1 Tax=Zafaria cholistanensis TaxID=1682741 RepID=A0A5A7NN68_9MICC|nr:flagellar basal-body MS-ring/collar protein FliF [Zafaria cholistanensis]GER21642.1 hypothetical protein NCCP1664_01390 [Zafaria cholistanensis]